MTAQTVIVTACLRVGRRVLPTVVTIALVASCGHERPAKPGGATASGGVPAGSAAKINTLLAAALLVQPKAKRFAELVAVLDQTTSASDRAAAIAFLVDAQHRTGDGMISIAAAKVYQDDPCGWPDVPSYFEYAREMNLQCRPFPSLHDVSSKVASMRSLDAADRQVVVRAVLDSVAWSQNRQEQDISRDTMLVLADAYKQTGDASIVDVFDAFDFGNGGYSITACSFYREIRETPGFVDRYGPEGAPRRALRRCVGISMSEEDFGAIRVNPPSP